MCGLCLCCLFVILAIVTHASSTTFKVFGQIGDNVTLPCSYGTRTLFGPSFCWGRGKVPRSKCSNTILSAKDGWLTYRQSTRYQLQEKLSDGDLSLTIVHAQRGDAGTYGCRVEVPGWFNDYKVNIRLSVEEVPTEEPAAKDWTPTTTVAQETTSAPWTLQTDDLMFGSAAIEEEPLVVEMKTASAFLFEEKLKEIFSLGNICRIVVFFFLSLVVILVYAFRWGFLRRTGMKAVRVSGMENIYESVPMSGQWAAAREQRHLQNS